jgi:2',3'-cyclic-nucleotide 2'-phosphodiesterase (5'-nucleotidase family)
MSRTVRRHEARRARADPGSTHGSAALLSSSVKPWLLLCLAALVVALGACESCKTPTTQTPKSDGAAGTATARLYLVSDLAGALEPCGCVKDQLGGMDHLGALVEKDEGAAKTHVVLSAGPLFFMDMELAADKRAQEIAKAETIAASMKALGLAAFAPGRNDWAAGEGELATLRAESGGALHAANVTAPGVAAGAANGVVKDVGGIKLGIVGVAAPDKAKVPLEGASSTPPSEAVKAAAAALRKQGAQAIVALAAVGRGEAKRIADANPDLLAVVVGSTGGGETNTEAPPPEKVGDVLVVETANHLQTVATLDLFVKDGAGAKLQLADGTGIDRMRKQTELTARIDELRKKIAVWEKDETIDPKDLAARRADVAKLEAERAALDQAPAPAAGSFYRFATHDIRESLGADQAVHGEMLAYYKKVNDQNKKDLASRVPKPPAKGEPAYAGVDTCSTCHEEPRAVWDKTQHAHAYATLSKQFKEYNLDCVSCHVTGYDRPGGSTVTHVDDLKDVQCEVCHGPGSLHVAKPEKVKVPFPKPSADACLACHHPPHVHTFDAKAKMAEILGPGHGRPSL